MEMSAEVVRGDASPCLLFTHRCRADETKEPEKERETETGKSKRVKTNGLHVTADFS